MSQTPTDQQAGSAGSAGTVLHVRPHAGRSACADDMATRLGATDLSIDTCHDIYRGLARASADQQSSSAGSGAPLRAMVVCMDVLGAAELEFFAVVARVRPQLPIYIYGETAVGSRLSRAVEFGAVSEATDNVINRLAEFVRSPQTIETQPEETELDSKVVDSRPPEIDTALDERLNLVTATRTAPDTTEQADDPADSPEDSVEIDEVDSSANVDKPGEDEGAKPVQVPWLNRPDRPVRGRPVDRAPSRKPPEPDVVKKENAPLRGAHEPLLTNEELQALLGDDLMDAHGSGSPNPFDDGGRS